MSNSNYFWPSMDSNLITNGMVVDQATIDSVLGALKLRTDYIKSRLDELAAGRALYIIGAPIGPGVAVGTPVYNNEGIYYPAQAKAVWDQTAGCWIAGNTSWVWGICTNVTDSCTGDIILTGVLNNIDPSTWPFDVAPAVTGPVYLSQVTAGKLTQTKSPIGILVGDINVAGAHSATFNISIHNKDLFYEHIHRGFDLTPSLWAAANPTYFPAANYPTDAVWGYHVASDVKLAPYWPPTPVDSCWLEVFYDDGTIFYQASPKHSDHATQVSPFVADANGIWCMFGLTDLVSDSSKYKFRLWFTKLISTPPAVVNSLIATAASPITITDAAGNPASTGDLTIDMNWSKNHINSTDTSITAVKTLSSLGYTTGPVVTGVTGSAGIAVGHSSPDGTSYGAITLTLASNSNSWNGPIELIALTDVREDILTAGDIPMLVFPKGVNGASRTSSIRGKVYISSYGLPSTPTMAIQFNAFPLDTTANFFSGIGWSFSYMLIPAGTSTPQPLSSTNFTPGNWELLPDADCDANNYVRCRTPAAAIGPLLVGGTYLFTITRNDSVATDVGVFDIRFVITSA